MSGSWSLKICCSSLLYRQDCCIRSISFVPDYIPICIAGGSRRFSSELRLGTLAATNASVFHTNAFFLNIILYIIFFHYFISLTAKTLHVHSNSTAWVGKEVSLQQKKDAYFSLFLSCRSKTKRSLTCHELLREKLRPLELFEWNPMERSPQCRFFRHNLLLVDLGVSVWSDPPP